jgi:S1-C subfamily serine protease
VDQSWRVAVPRVVQTRDTRGVVSDGSSWGSGVVIGPRLIVTAFHVANGGSEYRIEFPGGKTATAHQLMLHPEADVALLSTETDLPASPRALTTNVPLPGTPDYLVGHRPGYADPPAARPATLFGVGGPLVLYRQGPPITFATLLFDTPAGGGDSGGAIFSPAGELIGMVVGGSNDPVTGKAVTHVVPAALIQAAM